MDEVKVPLSFVEISRRLHAVSLPNVTHVVGISRGGVVLSTMIAHQLHLPLTIIALNYRDDSNAPRHDEPKLLEAVPVVPAGAHILLVDDVSVSGRTLNAAKSHFPDHQITTLVAKGQGDHVLFPDVPQCVIWPWKTAEPLDFKVA